MAKPKTEDATEADAAAEIDLDDAPATRPRGPMPSQTVMRRAAEEAIRTVRKEEATARAGERAARAAMRPAPKKPIPPERIAKMASVAAIWMVTVEDSIPSSEWLDPERLRNLISQAHIGDEIRFRNDAYTHRMDAEVIMVEASADKIVVRATREFDLPPIEHQEQIVGGFQACYLGLHDKWAVVRVADSQTLAKGLPSRAEAIYRITSDFMTRPVA